MADDQETPDINFTEETPDIDFSEIVGNSAVTEKAHFGSDEAEDIDDLDEPENYVENEDGGDDIDNDDDEDTNQTATDQPKHDKTKNGPKTNQENRLVQLPLARVKQIMKVDPDVSLITGECTFLVAKATELFIESMAREAFLHTAQAKKKTVQKRDVDQAIENVDALMFLEGMMNI